MKTNYYNGADGQKYATSEEVTEANKKYYESMEINDSGKIKYPDVQSKLKFELKTEPIKSANEKIIKPAEYLDAQTPHITFETQLMQVWNELTFTQQKAFAHIMAEQAEKNRQIQETPKKGK